MPDTEIGSLPVVVKPDTSSFRETLRRSMGEMVPIMLCDALEAIRDQQCGCVPDFRHGTPDEIWNAALNAAASSVKLAAQDQLNVL